jgi:NADPH-dependent 2,4-dienoyl-CoA reductase/sulfur reductase-like enzyme
MTSHEVTSLDPEAKTLELATGKTISFDNVIIATGGTPRSLPIPNFASPNVYQLRVPAEANAIYEQAKGARVVIVGSSFIGMEAAAGVVARAKSVTVIGMEKQPFERVLGVQVGAAMRKLHESKGVEFHMEAVVKEFQVETEGGPAVRALLSTGAVLEGDLFIVGAGVVPTTGFVKETGGIKKERDQSIMVDTRMRTAAPGVYVVGDIARFPYHAVGFDTIRVEHYGTAQQQGHIAGSNIALGDKGLVYDNVPFFWTQVFGKSIRYAGHAFMFTDTHVVGNVDGLDFIVVYAKEGRVDAVVTAGRDPQAAAAAELLRRGLMPKFADIVAAGDSIDFCALIKDAGM